MRNLNNTFNNTIKVVNHETEIELSLKTPFSGFFNISIVIYSDIKLNYNNMCDLYQFYLNSREIENNNLTIIDKYIKVLEDLEVDITINKTDANDLFEKNNWELFVVAKPQDFHHFFIVYETYFNNPIKYETPQNINNITNHVNLSTTTPNSKGRYYFYIIIFISVSILSVYFFFKSNKKEYIPINNTGNISSNDF